MTQASRHAGRHGAGALIDVDAERELSRWAFSERGEDPAVEAEFATSSRLADQDDGLDRYDPAEAAMLRMAVEPDPNEVFHDRYLGTEMEGGR